jgi:hypothetical protein
MDEATYEELWQAKAKLEKLTEVIALVFKLDEEKI